MTPCQHDPLFTTDGRCSKCYPRKTIVMAQNIDGAQETHPGWIVAQAVTNETAQEKGAAKVAEYHLTHQPLTGDAVNDALITAANAHNVKAFEWRRTHPDWRTRR